MHLNSGMNPIINENDVVIAVLQSIETADTLAAIKLANKEAQPLLVFVM